MVTMIQVKTHDVAFVFRADENNLINCRGSSCFALSI